MFTGLVEEVGQIVDVSSQEKITRMWVCCSFCQQLCLGDSVAINGCCLTVVDKTDTQFCVEMVPETVRKTSLGTLGPVNLERVLTLNKGLGGHLVQGHVDGLGILMAKGELTQIRVDHDILKVLVPKGSVTVDGVSLTVVDVLDESFRVALIPHTLEVTTLGNKRVGDALNIEVDIIGKYVWQFMQCRNRS